MRVLHVSSWFQPRLGYSEYHLPTAQQRLGHSVAVLTSDRYFPFPDYAATAEPLLGKRVVGAGTAVEHGLLTYRLPVAFEYRRHLWLRGFTGVVADFKPEIVHVYQAFTLPTIQAALAKSGMGYGLVVSSSMEKEVFYPQSVPRRVYYWLYKRLAASLLRRRVDAFTAVGLGAKELVADALRVPLERIDILPLGADTDRFRFDPTARSQVRGALSISDDVVLAIYAGKLIPGKDVHILLEALRYLDPRTQLGVLLVGNGPPEYAARLRSIAGGVRSPVFYQPPVPNAELARYFSAADIGAWPSESSNAAIEAAAVGLPLIVSASDATKHYIAGENGLSFTRGDPRALAGVLDRLASDPQLRTRMAHRGREYVVSNLSWNAAATRAIRLYEAVIARRRSNSLDVLRSGGARTGRG